MTKDEQRIAIAEACGWKWKYNVTRDSRWLSNGNNTLPDCYDLTVPVCEDGLENVPDYLNDLNAMHEAEKVLTHDKHIRFEQILSRICGDDFYEHKTHWSRDAVSAKAAQRAEAFLRTLNLWRVD